MTQPFIHEIQRAVCAHYGLALIEMTSKTRKSARQRQVAMFLARRMTPKSYPEIGRFFGARDHTTVMYGEGKIDALRRADRGLARSISRIGAAASRMAYRRRLGQ